MLGLRPKLHYTDTGSNTGYGHHQRTPPTDKLYMLLQHVRSRLNLLYNILPATDTNGRAHNNSTTFCTTNSPPTDKNLPHPNICTCQDVGIAMWQICCRIVVSSSVGGVRWWYCTIQVEFGLSPLASNKCYLCPNGRSFDFISQDSVAVLLYCFGEETAKVVSAGPLSQMRSSS